jgi:hypothetical protein
MDAPIVVSIWTMAIALCTGASVERASFIALAATVWFIYLGDRAIDVCRCRDWSAAPGRMLFGQRYLRLILTLMLFPVLINTVLLVRGFLPVDVIHRGLFAAGGMMIYLTLFVLPCVLTARLIGKELVVGLFFAMGSWVVIGFENSAALPMVTLWMLVCFNCLVIAAREREYDYANDPSGAGAWWRHIRKGLPWLGWPFVVGSLLLPAWGVPTWFAISAASAFILLLILHRLSPRLSQDAVRSLADYSLLAPCPWIIWLLLQ